MEGNCNLELGLVTPSVSYHSSSRHRNSPSQYSMLGGNGKEEKQQLTIFYNGRVTTCDATELQARAIIMHARRQLEEKENKSSGSDPLRLHGPATAGLSMKRSLQRFLQKRKTRAQSTSPYTLTPQHHQR